MSTFYLTLSSLVLLWTGVNGQDYSDFIPVCASDCAPYVQTSVFCSEQYPYTVGKPPSEFQACFCNAIDQAHVSECAACLSKNKAPSVAQLVTNTTDYCKEFKQNCVYQCNFPTCDRSNVQCQCQVSYLQNIYDCASCNTANDNPGKTELSDYNTLYLSCINQGLLNVNDVIKSTKPYPSPTSAAGYVEPALTGNGVFTPAAATTTTPAAVPPTGSASAQAGGGGGGPAPTTQAHLTTPVMSIIGRTTPAAASLVSFTSLSVPTSRSGAEKKGLGASSIVGGAAAFLLSLLTI